MLECTECTISFGGIVTEIHHCNVDRFIKIIVTNDCICSASDQKFYLADKNRWICADELIVSDKLLCGDGNVVCIDMIEIVYQQQEMYALSVEKSHLFYVGHAGIIAHNIEPVSSTTAVVAVLSFICPPAGAAVIVGEIIAFGFVGLGCYCAHKKTSKK
ncbi:MAG TPA: polymorphic toxin-type HINT domain-containing protein [Candidatus Babeliales bacterium]|nr:polymorphic toxin-type HINT domain-containing protein [Candidatus Babeliales bacterium]